MASTEKRARAIDRRLPNTGGGTSIGGGEAPGAGPALPAPGAPQNVRILSTLLLFSAVTPSAGANVAWAAPAGTTPDGYLVQWAVDAAFTNPSGRTATAGQTTMGLDGMPVNTVVYVRVAARVRSVLGPWSATASATTPQDVAPPDPPANVAAVFLSSGDLRISWDKPTSPNFRAVEIRIFNSAAKTVEYDLIPQADGTVYDWPAARNRARSVGSPDGSPDRAVFVELRAISWGGTYSTVVTASATLAAPLTPTGLASSWAADPGTAGAECIITWLPLVGLRYELTIDGANPREVVGGRYPYSLTLNAQEHAGTANPVLALSLVAIDPLDGRSPAATLTATNAAPPATTITAYAGFQTIALSITRSTAADLRDYRVRITKDGALLTGRTFFTRDEWPVIEVQDGQGSYQFDVTVYDLFGQASTVSALTASVFVDPLTIEQLRADVEYRDSPSTAPATLKAILADGVI